MYIQWTVFCKNEKNHEMMEKISRIMDYEQATPEKGFYVSKRWKWPETSRIGRAYYACCLPRNLEAQFAALDPEATVRLVEQEHFLEYTLSTLNQDILSNPERVFVACSIYTNL